MQDNWFVFLFVTCTFEKNKVCLFLRPAGYVMCMDRS